MNGRILVIDDEEAILDILRIMLEVESFEVDTASDGEEALEILENKDVFVSNPNYYDFILTDIIMPKMNGLELIKIIDERLPYQNILVVSAYTDSNSLFDFINERENIEFLPKPFDIKDLKERLNSLSLKEQMKETETLRNNYSMETD